MKPIKFKGCNCVYAENQKPYRPLPARKTRDGRVTSCYALSLFERIKVLITGKVYLSVLTFYKPLIWCCELELH